MSKICFCSHFLTDKEVAMRYGISRPTIWRWLKKGKFPRPKKLLGSTRWKLEDLEIWEDNLPESESYSAQEDENENLE